ncbi:MAG: carboxypeptidase-like regulatory domain-containing protein [Chthoniobacterales bacterium]
MHSKYRLIAFAFSSLFLMSTGFGQPVKIEGVVKGANNKPAKGADLRVDRVDKKAAPVMAKTDAKGHFAATVLDVGTYKLTAMLPGGIQSAQVIKADGKKQLFVTFDMKPASATTVAAVKKKRQIWVPSSTGTHMLGHWEDVDDNSPASRTSGQNVDTMSGRDMERTMSGSIVAPSQPGGR